MPKLGLCVCGEELMDCGELGVNCGNTNCCGKHPPVDLYERRMIAYIRALSMQLRLQRAGILPADWPR